MSSNFALDLSHLANGMPGLTSSRGLMMAEAAAVCLNHCKHKSGVTLAISGVFTERPTMTWPQVHAQMQASYNDLQEATEHGAYGIAILGTCRLSGSVVVDRSVKGTGFDFWLGSSDDTTQPPFTGVTRLEISGILKGNPSKVNSRTSIKTKQVSPTNSIGPAYIAIVDFLNPELRIS